MDKEKAYSTLSELIFKGFIVADLNIGGESLIVKTINNRELDTIRILSGNPGSPGYTVRFNAYYLAFSVVSIEGENFLINRDGKVKDLYQKFLKLTVSLFRNIIRKTNNIRAEALMAAKYLEGFCYTKKSRRLWQINGGIVPNKHFLTGFLGTSELGMNVFQENWVLINRVLDSEDDYNNKFSMALLIASASNPKGTRKIRNQHQGHIRNVEERRSKLATQGFIDEKKWSSEGWAAPVDTTEELVAELNRQMSGVKDKHDVFIDNYMQKLKDDADRRTKEAENRIKRAREGLEDIYITSTQRALTPEEMSNLIKNRNKSIISTSSETQASENDKQRFLNKVSGRVLTARGK